MDEAFLVGVLCAIAIAVGILAGYQINHKEHGHHRISCLELNLGKETCDKIFNNKE
tara:strand:+ start:2385 stop:2552 length:168 start_codon:yes stop_codon:yes gene_type:complete